MITIEHVENIEIHVEFQLDVVNNIMDKLDILGEIIMSMADKVTELEASLAATAASIEGVKVVVAAEALEVKTRIDELVALVGGITPGTVMTEAKLDEILATAKTLQTSAEGLTKAVEAIYVPAVTPPTTKTDINGNIIDLATGNMVSSDGTVRYAAGTFTAEPDGSHKDMAGNTILTSSIL